jgi:hypothetical protein
MNNQRLTFNFTRELLRCPACNQSIQATYAVSTASDGIAPIERIDGMPTQRFELTGELTGIRLSPHDCIPKVTR